MGDLKRSSLSEVGLFAEWTTCGRWRIPFQALFKLRKNGVEKKNRISGGIVSRAKECSRGRIATAESATGETEEESEKEGEEGQANIYLPMAV